MKNWFDKNFNIQRGEWPRVTLLATFFFLVIADFWVLKSMKRGILVGWYEQHPLNLFGWILGGPEVEQLAKVFNMFVAYGVIVLFTYLSQRYNRQQFVSIISLLYGAMFLLFGYWINSMNAGLAWSFFIFGDMFNTTMVTLFWAFTNDLSSAEESRRTYGLIGLGGILGGFAGSTFVQSFVEQMGRSSILYASVIPMLLIALIGYLLNKYFFLKRNEPGELNAEIARPGPKSGLVLKGAHLVSRIPYLKSIALLVAFYEIVSNLVDFQLSVTVAQYVEGSLNKDAYFAYIGQITNLLSLGVQLLLTGYVMQRFGVGTALLFLPVAILAGGLGFLVAPTLLFATVMSASDNSLNYSINQSAKESLYVPTSREQKYLAKAFIDMFVQRFAKVLSVMVTLSISYFTDLIDIRLVTLVMLILIAIWMIRIRFMNSKYEKLAQEEELKGNFYRNHKLEAAVAD